MHGEATEQRRVRQQVDDSAWRLHKHHSPLASRPPYRALGSAGGGP
jgi:hypothetical protein